MVHFAIMDAPALPVHDSFILHHAYAETGEVEEAMRRAFYSRFQADIPVSEEVIDWTYRKDSSDTKVPQKIDIDKIVKTDVDVSHWRDRHNIWYKMKQIS